MRSRGPPSQRSGRGAAAHNPASAAGRARGQARVASHAGLQRRVGGRGGRLGSSGRPRAGVSGRGAPAATCPSRVAAAGCCGGPPCPPNQLLARGRFAAPRWLAQVESSKTGAGSCGAAAGAIGRPGPQAGPPPNREPAAWPRAALLRSGRLLSGSRLPPVGPAALDPLAQSKNCAAGGAIL